MLVILISTGLFIFVCFPECSFQIGQCAGPTRFGARPRKPGWISVQFELRSNALRWRIDHSQVTPLSVRNLSRIAHIRRSALLAPAPKSLEYCAAQCALR